jgi:hypothetical protein
MVSNPLVAAIVGTGLGAFRQKGRFCVVHAFRDLFAFEETRVTHGVVLATTPTAVFWSVACELGHHRGFWTPG